MLYSCLSRASVTWKHGIHSTIPSSRKDVRILTSRRLASRTGLCKTQLGETEEVSFDFIQVFWVEASLWKWKTWIQILLLLAQAQVYNIFPQWRGKLPPSSGLFQMGAISITLVLLKDWAGNSSGETKAWDQQQRGGSSSCSSSGDSRVQEAERTDVDHKMQRSTEMAELLESWASEYR